jgi:drug/metabolite transporter (DMT)-like permease
MPSASKPSRDYFLKGVLPIFLASVLWAFGYFIRKRLLGDISPIVLTGVISAIVAVFIYAVYRPGLGSMGRHFRAHTLKFIGLSFSGVLFGSTLMLVGLDRLDLGVATLLEKLQPLFTIGMAALFLKERLPAKLIPYCLLALASSYFISTAHPWAFAYSTADLVGIAAIVGAAFLWGISSVLGRFLALENIPSAELVFLRFAITAVATLPIVLFSYDASLRLNFNTETWLFILAAGIGGTGYGYVLYYKGLKHVDAPTAGFVELITPVVALLLGIIFLSEHLSPSQWAAIPVLLFSVWRITAAPRLPVVEEAA